MDKLNLAVLYGGKSGEHEVSRRSAASVLRQLDRDRYAVTAIGIDRSGAWHLQPEPVFETLANGDPALVIVPSDQPVAIVPAAGLWHGGARLAVDCVFPVLHGSHGEDGKLQGALDTAGLAYVGAGVLGSSAAMDKAVAKSLWRDAGLPVVDFRVGGAGAGPDVLAEALQAFGWPLFVKPCSAGSSLGASRANTAAELEAALAEALRHDTRALIEPCLDVRELECSVLGNEEITVFPPGEIVPNASHSFYDYEAKYADPDGASLHAVAQIDARLQQSIMDLARAAYAAVRCEGLGRVDFFLDKKTGRLFLNEINTLPGFTSISMYPRMCAAGGLDYAELLDRLIRLALQRGPGLAI
jgi:D-alanine-D-alanine ligase